MARRINSKYYGKKFGSWEVVKISKTGKYRKVNGGSSDSYCYTYTLANFKKNLSLTLSGTEILKLAKKIKTISDTIKGKKYCYNINLNRPANLIRSI